MRGKLVYPYVGDRTRPTAPVSEHQYAIPSGRTGHIMTPEHMSPRVISGEWRQLGIHTTETDTKV
jgi:hypothetical protein